MPSIERLAHVGIHVLDLERSLAFYRDILGLQVSDDDREHGLTFLSSRPDIEHHEILLTEGRTAAAGELWLQQISFRCSTLEDVIEFHQRFVEHGVKIEYTVTHGNAIGVYFYDPDGNRCEVYWPTGLVARQGYLQAVDLTQSPAEIIEGVRRGVDQYGETGVIDASLLETMDVETAATR
ncbi:VOC family protein [Modestobacter lapidis]|nr:glyoxalase [Modestobacter lapidis]